jgi:N-[(2S)-2-amino-2-carboxyethyl]-L-glutamate dehydrogenase
MIYLSHNDLLNSQCSEPEWALSIVSKAIQDYQEDLVYFPTKTVQTIETKHKNRINCLPAVSFARGVAGVKWVSVFPSNPGQHQLKNLTALILLSEINTGMPLALLDGTLCSNMRTAAVSTLAAMKLACATPQQLVIFGAGEQAMMNLIFLKHAFPSLRTCCIYTRTSESAERFISKMSVTCTDIELITANTSNTAPVKAADIIVTATSSQGPHLKAEWLKAGVFYSHIGGWEDEFEVALHCDKIVCDNWEHVKQGSQTLAKMYAEGLISDQDIYADLPELITQLKSGRSTENERIYFNAIGLSYADISLAHAMYERAVHQGYGQALPLEQSL